MRLDPVPRSPCPPSRADRGSCAGRSHRTARRRSPRRDVADVRRPRVEPVRPGWKRSGSEASSRLRSAKVDRAGSSERALPLTSPAKSRRASFGPGPIPVMCINACFTLIGRSVATNSNVPSARRTLTFTSRHSGRKRWIGSVSFTFACSTSDSSATDVTGLVIEYQRQMAWSSSASCVSRSMDPAVIRWATWPCRPTTIWNPATLPVSTKADRKCSSIRANRPASKPAAAGLGSDPSAETTNPPAPAPSRRRRWRRQFVGGRGRCGRDQQGPGGFRHRRSQCPSGAIRPQRPGSSRSRARASRRAAVDRERPTRSRRCRASPSAPANKAPDGSHSLTCAATSTEPTSTYGGLRHDHVEPPRRPATLRTRSRGRCGRCGRRGRGRRGSPGRRRARRRLASVIQTVVPSSGSSTASDSPIAPDPVPRSATVRVGPNDRASSIADSGDQSRSPVGGSAPAGRPSARGGGSPTGRARTAAARRSPSRASIASRWATIRSVAGSSRLDANSSAVDARRATSHNHRAAHAIRRPSRSSPPTARRQFTASRRRARRRLRRAGAPARRRQARRRPSSRSPASTPASGRS